MIDFNVDFEITAIVIDVIMILLYYQRRSLPSASNVFFRRIMLITLATSVINVITVQLMDMEGSVPNWLNYSLNILYFILQNIQPAIFVLYAASFLEVKKSIVSRINFIEAIISIIIVALVVTTPFTKVAFYFDEKGVYHRQFFIYVLFAISFVQFFVVALITIKQWKKVKVLQKSVAMAVFVCFLTTSVIIQLVFAELLVTGFAISCACLIMYMLLQTPIDAKDEQSGLYRRNAFMAAVTESYRNEKGFTIIAVIPNNSDHIISAMGRNTYMQFLGKIGDFLTTQYIVDAFSIESNAVTFILNNPVNIDEVVSNINKRFESAWTVGGMNINSTCSVAYTGYPEPLDRLEDIVPAVDYMISKVENGEVESPFYAQDVPRITDQVGKLEAEKRLLEAETKEAAEAKEKAELENKQKNVFMANMSHEIRTPMNAILGMSELVLRDDISPRVRDMVEDIQRASESLLNLVNDLLDVTKIESDTFELVNEKFSLKTVVLDAVTISATRITSDDLEMLVEIDKNVPEYIVGDESRLKQLFVNLLNNAVKYSRRGYVKLIVDGEYENGLYNLYVEVEDTGSGIKNQDKKKLFNTFSRALNDKNANVEGTGLGLAICKRIITIMGGNIDFESNYGVGSRFFFNVPFEVAGSETIINERLHENKEVLVCSGERYERRVERLKSILFGMNIPYYIVTSIDDAKEKLKKHRITDIFITKQIYDIDRDVFDKTSAHINLMYDRSQQYDDVVNAGILYEPIHILNVQKLLEERKVENVVKDVYTAPKNANVLVVDDNLVNLKVITSLLSQFGITADTAKGGFEAVEKAGLKRYDLIFMDHMMPDMDGIEAMNNIRALSTVHRRMPIVMLTANAVNGAEEMFREQHFDEFVSKPVSMERLEQVLKKFLK